MSWATKSTVTEQLYVEPIFTHQRPSVGLYLCLYKDRTEEYDYFCRWNYASC